MNHELRTMNSELSNLYSPSYLKQLCQEYGLSPSKKYGQNYLVNSGIIEKITKAAELKKTDTVVEIGPGFGVLTLAMAKEVKKVVAFEIEKKLENYWEEKQKEFENVEIVWGDALNKIQDTSNKIQSYKVVANLPYQITSNILRVILESKNKPESITVMVQKEVAERICAKAGEMSLLAVSVQYFGEPKIITKVSKGNFWPSPKVDSAVLSIKTLKHKNKKAKKQESQPSGDHPKADIKTSFTDEEFFRVVRAGFANKRKQLWRNLSEGLQIDKDKVKTILTEILGNDKVRAQELTVEDWKSIVSRL